MAFVPNDFTLATDTIGGGSLRLFFYATTDALADVLATGYATEALDRGAREGDIVLVYIDDELQPGTYALRVAEIDADGTATFTLDENQTLALKVAVSAATTTDITLAGIQTIDGVAGAVGKRILVKNEPGSITNGIYIMAVGDWPRADDFATSRDVVKGTLVLVTDGTVNRRSFWVVTSDDPIEVGVDPITFERQIGEVELEAILAEAEAARDKAEEWAQNPYNDPVETGQFSALHHATVAQLAAAAAMVAGDLYVDEAAFLAGTVDGEYGFILGEAGGDIFATLYLNDTETAVEQDLAIPSYAAYAALAALIGPSDIPWEVTDPLGNTLARVTGDEATIGGLVLKHGGDGKSVELQDPEGYVSVRLAALMSMINGWNFMADVPGMTEIQDMTGYIIARFDKAESMINGLYIRPDGNSFEIQDLLGYILWRAGVETVTEDSGGTSDQPTSTVPLFGPYLYGVDNEITPLILDNVLTDRLDAPLCQATILPATGIPRAFEHSIDLDTSSMGATATLIVRPRVWDGAVASELPLAVRACANPAPGSLTPKILVLGDSIPTYQGPYIMDIYLDAWGVSATWKGTTGTEGATPSGTPGHFNIDLTFMGECRPGIELGDYTNLNAGTIDPVAIGDEATYLALGTSAKRTFNPLIIEDDTVVDDGDLRNGYFIDFGTYDTRFSIGGIDVLFVSLCTNDINALNSDQVYSRVLDEMSLLHRRWRAFSATKAMIVAMPGTGRSETRDPIWKNKYTRAIRALLAFQADAADDNLHIVPVWAHVVSDSGYDLTPAAQSPDAVTGVIARTLDDAVHPTGIVRRELWRVSAMGAAYAITNIVP